MNCPEFHLGPVKILSVLENRRADLMFGIPPESIEDVTLKKAPKALFGTQSQRKDLPPVVELQFDQPLLGLFAKFLGRDEVALHRAS